jgi:hypothetical protein
LAGDDEQPLVADLEAGRWVDVPSGSEFAAENFTRRHRDQLMGGSSRFTRSATSPR